MAKKRSKKKTTRGVSSTKKVTKKKATKKRASKTRHPFDASITDVAASDFSHGGHHAHAGHAVVITSERRAVHRGCDIRVKTTYEISVNGEPYSDHVIVGNDGRLFAHSCPYNDFSSALEMMKHIVDIYPEFFERCGQNADRPATPVMMGGMHR